MPVIVVLAKFTNHQEHIIVVVRIGVYYEWTIIVRG